MPTCTPAELAAQIWGSGEAESRSAGARTIRKAARELFADEAPGQGGEWHLTEEQAALIRERVASA